MSDGGPDMDDFETGIGKLRVTGQIDWLRNGAVRVDINGHVTIYPPDHPKAIAARALVAPVLGPPDEDPIQREPVKQRIANIDYETRTVTFEPVK